MVGCGCDVWVGDGVIRLLFVCFELVKFVMLCYIFLIILALYYLQFGLGHFPVCGTFVYMFVFACDKNL